MNFTVSAPGKIILAGEHAVVYGYRGIASSINLRCQATIKIGELNDKVVSLGLRNIPFDFKITETEYKGLLMNVDKYLSDPTSTAYHLIMNDFLDEKMSEEAREDLFIRQGLLVFLDLCFTLMKDCWRAVDISINSEFSYGSGLGSSAAYSTVLATALLIIQNGKGVWEPSPTELERVSALAFRGEQIVHGTPSGIDNCISTFGGSLLFQRLPNSVVRCVVATPHLPVLLVDTRVKRCTKTVVGHVKKLTTECPDKYHQCFSAMDEIAMRLVDQLRESRPHRAETINRLVAENQVLLQALDVSHPSIDDIVILLNSYGISAKLTGAGWGGCVFAFVEGVSPVVLDEVSHNLMERGYGVQLTHLSCPGVFVEAL